MKKERTAMRNRWARIFVLVQTISLSGLAACAGESGPIKDNGDGTITDIKTGLMWQTAKSGDMSWPAARKYCHDLSFAGHSDWTLPTKDQLVSLWNDGGLRSTAQDVYWSSEIAPNTYVFGNLVWIVDFKDGSVSQGPSTESGKLESHHNIVNNTNLGALLWSARCTRVGK